MTIQTIYKKYQIPLNLQLHMLRVTAMGNYLLDHCKKRNTLDRHLITQTLLLHDMGNIIKFDLDKSKIPDNNLKYWKKIQQKYIKKYGKNEHKATELIVKEITENTKILNILKNIGAAKLHLVTENKDWSLKLCSYSDARITPDGVATIQDRFEDGIKRYAYRRPPEFIVKVKNALKFALKLETQIQTQVTINLQQITDQDIEPYIERRKDYNITHAT